jgi:hypothetical protein
LSDIGAPLKWMPVAESLAPEKALVPIPRMVTLLPRCPCAKVTLGTPVWMSGPPSIFCAFRLSLLKAETAMGTFWRLSSRR